MAIKEKNFRIVVLGDYSVGKSSITLQYVKNEFNPNEESTIGAAFLTKTVLFNDEYIKFEIWDTAGQERYNSLIPMYYRGAQAALIVFDVSNAKSFLRAKAWIQELATEKPQNFIKVLIGNKVDLENREINYEEANEFAQQNKIKYYEASAKAGENIEKIFCDLCTVAPQNIFDDRTEVVSLKKRGGFGCC
ncbi:hypothetical protein H311_03127 [Anncaliia algerae PRA109]|nr:hypothetical protein H311_03127 [Anncaliia algerae PRA109]